MLDGLAYVNWRRADMQELNRRLGNRHFILGLRREPSAGSVTLPNIRGRDNLAEVLYP